MDSINEGKPKILQESQIDIIEEIKYTEDESPEFDFLLKSGREVMEARQNSLSKVTKSGILFSDWHVPCHSIIVRTKNGDCQLFHVQPNKQSSSLLSYEQENTLKSYEEKNTKFIVAKGIRSWFGINDVKELENMKINKDKIIDVNTSNWWRLIYDSKNNQVWIDVKDKKTLFKYKGFNI